MEQCYHLLGHISDVSKCYTVQFFTVTCFAMVNEGITKHFCLGQLAQHLVMKIFNFPCASKHKIHDVDNFKTGVCYRHGVARGAGASGPRFLRSSDISSFNQAIYCL